MIIPTETIKHHLVDLSQNLTFQKHVKNIKEGRFKRESQNPNYLSRLEYTKTLRLFVYNPACMNTILMDAELKELFFRTFGYRGNVNFTIYPNAWLRDLPLLDIGKNTYLADGILLGTNQVSTDQQFITVGKISIGDHTIIDQRGAIGYSTNIGKNCTLGLRFAIGIKGSIGNNTSTGEMVAIGHGVKIGNNVSIGQGTIIGNMSTIDDDITIGLGKTIPAFSHVTQNGIYHKRTQKRIA